MSMFPTKILLATDGSPEAMRAARAAVELTERTGSELHAVHVAPMPSIHAIPERAAYAPEATFQELQGIAEREGQKALDEQVHKIEEAGGKIAESHLRVGRSDEKIVGLAEEIGAGLVVLGNRGYGPLRRVLMGSVSDSVVRHAHSPVLVVRPRGYQERGILDGRILLAIDGSEEASTAARVATELAKSTGSELHVTFGMPTEPEMPYPHLLAGERWDRSLEQAEQEARKFVEKQAERIGAEDGVTARAHLRLGHPDQEIVRLGEELDAGLIVMGSRGLGGVRRALMGSVSDSVVRHAHGSVLIVRSQDDSPD